MSETEFSRTQLTMEQLEKFLRMQGIKNPNDPFIKQIKRAMSDLQASETLEAAINHRLPKRLSFKAEVVRFNDPEFGNGNLLLIGRQDEKGGIDKLNTNRWIPIPERRIKP